MDGVGASRDKEVVVIVLRRKLVVACKIKYCTVKVVSCEFDNGVVILRIRAI